MKFQQKTCFVLIGSGTRTDVSTGRTVDLDKTFHHILKPIFEDLGIKSIQENLSMIQASIHQQLNDADFVVADIATLTPEIVYTLGIRNDIKPNTTIGISEKDNARFALNENQSIILIDSFQDFDISIETEEIQKLKDNVLNSVTRLFNIEKPNITVDSEGFTNTIKLAENALEHYDFEEAENLYKQALLEQPNNTFIQQRIALVTYKSLPNDSASLKLAEEMLMELQKESNAETLGLLGAVNKRFYQTTKNDNYIERSLSFYEKGYFDLNDYYNGINTAYLYLLKSNRQTEKQNAVALYDHCTETWGNIVIQCNAIIGTENFADRTDQRWVYQTLAQAYFGLGQTKNYDDASRMVIELSKGLTDLQIFYEQNDSLKIEMELFQANYMA